METNKKGLPVWGWIGIGVGVLFLLVCGISVVGAALSGPAPERVPTEQPTTEQPTSDDQPTSDEPEALKVKPTTKPPAPRKPTIEDGLYHVGEDIQPGTYRLAEPVDDSDLCYWRKSRDAEGEDILDNDLASTGRLQVTIKAGQWFETNRCGTWVKK